MTLLPSLASVTQSNNAQFLASSSPSVQAGALAAPFRGLDPTGTALIVAYRASGPLTAADKAAIGQVEQAARGVAGGRPGHGCRGRRKTARPPGPGDRDGADIEQQHRLDERR